MFKKYFIASMLIAIFVAGAFIYKINNNTNAKVAAASSQAYTLQEVAQHNSANSCWMIINGNVYDVTGYITKHPGGSRILNGCGQDATNLFNGQGMDSHMHGAMAKRLLKSYQVGVLIK